MLCRNFSTTGRCPWGQKCKFSHSRPRLAKDKQQGTCPSGPMCKLAWERKCKYPHKIEDLYCREGRMCKSWPNCKARHFDSDVEYLRSQRPDSEKRLGIGKDENRAEKIKKLEKQEDPWMRKAKVARDERCEREEREEREERKGDNSIQDQKYHYNYKKANDSNTFSANKINERNESFKKADQDIERLKVRENRMKEVNRMKPEDESFAWSLGWAYIEFTYKKWLLEEKPKLALNLIEMIEKIKPGEHDCPGQFSCSVCREFERRSYNTTIKFYADKPKPVQFYSDEDIYCVDVPEDFIEKHRRSLLESVEWNRHLCQEKEE